MKIAIITQNLARGGAEKQAILSVVALQRLGYDAKLISLGANNDFGEMILRNGVRLQAITARGFLRYRRLLLLWRLLRDQQSDVVHCFDMVSSAHGRLAAWIAGVPKIFGGVRDDQTPPFLVRSVNRLGNLFTCKWIANAERCKAALIRDLHVQGKHVFVVRNAIIMDDHKGNLSPADAKRRFAIDVECPCVTMIANLRPEKNHEMFLRVARKILDSGRKVSFVAAGDGPRRVDLEQMSLSMNLQKHVRFLGRCDNINELLRATDVVLHTSYFEGTPNSLLEAGAQEVPCVACASGGVSEVVQDGLTGFLVPPDDDEAMVERTVQLLSDDALRLEMGQQFKDQIQANYSLEALGRNLLAVYRQDTHGR
ncbi:MAG: glycosyltransferase [Desulfomonile sp.]|jgi:glycosyltransferase involved in cell wall biosynthesis